MNMGVFTGVCAKWLPLYEELKSMAQQALGAFEEHETANAVLWREASAFAEVSAKKGCMVVAFASDTIHDEWEPAKTLQTSKNRVAHYFEVIDDSLFPVLVERIMASYALTQSGKARSGPAPKPAYATIEEYIALFPQDVRGVLEKIRQTIREAAPDAQEKIAWQMPTFWQNENLVHFAAAKRHVGFYPGESGVSAFADRLAGYKTTRGAIQFPFSQPMPYELIAQITRFRAQEAGQKAGQAPRNRF